MIHNELFRECLDSIPEERRTEFNLSFAIAERIDSILKQKGMSQREFAAKMGKRESEISKWLTGRHNFTISTIAKIGYVLETQIIRIYGCEYSEQEDCCSRAAEEQDIYGEK